MTGQTLIISLVVVLAIAIPLALFISKEAQGVDVHKMGGPIDVAEAPHGADLMTMGGPIHLGNVDSFAKLKTMAGNITIDQANASIDATTMAGDITIDQANASIDATTMAGDIRARITGSFSDRRHIELSSNQGTITLIVPKDFSMDVNVTLAYTQNSTKTFRIIDELGLSQDQTDHWDSDHGTPRKYLKAKGRVGDGQNRVVISTINGDVIIKQE